MEQTWFKEPKKKKKKRPKETNYARDGMQIGMGLIGLGVGLSVLHDLTD